MHVSDKINVRAIDKVAKLRFLNTVQASLSMHTFYLELSKCTEVTLVFIDEYSVITADYSFGIAYSLLFVCMQRHCLGEHHLHQGHTLNWRRRFGVTNLLR